MSAPSSHQFHALCLSLARSIDYGLAQKEVPASASKLPSVLKMVCSCRNECYLQPVIMVLMISVKNACKLNWFPDQDTEELLALADEVASNFVTRKDISSEVCNLLPTMSTIIYRYYPQFKVGKVLGSLEVKPGYTTHLVDFHIRKDIVISRGEKIYLFVAMRDNIDTSSCVVPPQEVNILLNGNSVERRNRASMDSGPQLPTSVNHHLKYGINLLQVVGQFNGDYIFVIALMSCNPSSSALPIPQDYEQPVSTATISDSELIEGPSLVSLNCPISKIRIRIPVKGQLCKHYQSFDFTTYVEMNFKRPSWRCPSCNQSVSFADLRVDQKMVKALQELGENESEVVFSIDGSFKPASSNKHRDESHNKALANQLCGQELESFTMFDGPGNMFDLTGGDDEMDTIDRCETVDTKPVVNPNVQAQSLSSTVTLPSVPRSTTKLIQCTSAKVSNSQSSEPVIHNSLPVGFNTRPQAQIGGRSGNGSYGTVPVLTDAVSPALSRQSDSLGANFPISTFSSNSTPTSLQVVQEALYSQAMMNSMEFTRNLGRVSSAIQAFPVQTSNTSPHLPNNSQQHFRPTVSLPTASVPSAPFQMPIGFNAQFSSPCGTNVERQQHLSQSNASPQIRNMTLVSLQNRSFPPPVQQGVGHLTPIHTLSQPSHMRSSELPRNHNQHGVGLRVGASNSTTSNHPAFQRVQLMSSQASQMRLPLTMPLQTQPAVRMPSSSFSLNSGGSVAPHAVSRTETLINLQSEQNWRPTARMRGALAGSEYEEALRSRFGPAALPIQTPSPKVSTPLSGLSTRPNIDVLLASRRIAYELQDQSANGNKWKGLMG